MAAPTEDWRDKLKVHPICKRLKDIASKRHSSDATGDAKSLLAIKNGDLFVWDSFSANVVHCNLKTLLSVSQPKGNDARFQVCWTIRILSLALGIHSRRFKRTQTQGMYGVERFVYWSGQSSVTCRHEDLALALGRFKVKRLAVTLTYYLPCVLTVNKEVVYSVLYYD